MAKDIKQDVLSTDGPEPIDLGACSPPARSTYSHTKEYSVPTKFKDDYVGLGWGSGPTHPKTKIAQLDYSDMHVNFIVKVDFWKSCCCVKADGGIAWRWQLAMGSFEDVVADGGFDWTFRIYTSAAWPIQREWVIYKDSGSYSMRRRLNSLDGTQMLFNTSCRAGN